MSEDKEYALSLIISFVLVKLSENVLQRYMTASYHLMKFHWAVRTLCVKVILFGNGFEGVDFFHIGNVHWRRKMQKVLIDLVNAFSAILQDPILCRNYLEGYGEEEDKSSSAVDTEDSSTEAQRSFHPNYSVDRGTEAIELDKKLQMLTQSIADQKEMLANPMEIQKEINLLNDVHCMLKSVDVLLSLGATPLSFPFVNIIRITLGCWILIIPFIQKVYSPINFAVVFFLTYAVIGIDSAASEMTDPLGDDPNDLEVYKLANVRK